MTRHPMPRGSTPAENYQLYFVPAIGAPLAEELVRAADLRPGQRVLDVACGTGVVTRLAVERVGASGAVAGLDVNPDMLAVARAQTASGAAIDWHQASAEAMPFADDAFDVLLCQMGLQFVPDRASALREMRRVLVPGGRAFISVPGPKPPVFAILAEALGRRLGPKAAGFVDLVFSIHDADAFGEMVRDAGFRHVEVRTETVALRLPAPADFLWQYIASTPLAEPAAGMDTATRDALEQEVCAQWERYARGDSLALDVEVKTAVALK